jgi:hypothetical protein
MGSVVGKAVPAASEVVSALVFNELIEGATSELPEFGDGRFRSVSRSLLEYFVWSDTCILVTREISDHQLGCHFS